MTSPLVSVIMSVYNDARYLRQAIESILNQTLCDFEFIIINDGSTDRSGRILDRYARRDERIRVIHQENTGLTKALNRGLAEAGGELIARMDADDISLPERFEKQVAFLAEHPEVVAVGSAVESMDGGGRPVRVTRYPVDGVHLSQALLTNGAALCHPAVMMRREPVLARGGYDERYVLAQDRDLWLKLEEHGTLANVSAILLRYRVHVRSISTARRLEQVRYAREAIQEACSRRGIVVDLESMQGEPAATAIERRRRWVNQAMTNGYHATARHHAVVLALRYPWVMEHWRMLRRLVPWLGWIRRPRWSRGRSTGVGEPKSP